MACNTGPTDGQMVIERLGEDLALAGRGGRVEELIAQSIELVEHGGCRRQCVGALLSIEPIGVAVQQFLLAGDEVVVQRLR
jgi:hypothetical protein